MKRLAPELKRAFLDSKVIDDESVGDGIRVELPNGLFVVRYSQNGPYIVIKIEAKTEAQYQDLRQKILKILQGYTELNWDPKNNINVNIVALTGRL